MSDRYIPLGTLKRLPRSFFPVRQDAVRAWDRVNWTLSYPWYLAACYGAKKKHGGRKQPVRPIEIIAKDFLVAVTILGYIKTIRMPWDSVEVGLAGGEETVNFGPRNESGSSLYQVDTLASVSPRGEVRFCSLSNTFPSLCVDREGTILWIFVQRKTARTVLLTARQSMPTKMTNIGMIAIWHSHMRASEMPVSTPFKETNWDLRQTFFGS